MKRFCWTMLIALLLRGSAMAQPPGQELEQYYRLGARYTAASRYTEALAAYQSALSIATRAYGPSDERILLALEKVYQTHVSLQDWVGAEKDRRQALDITIFCHPKEDPAVARERVRLASFLAERQRYPECESLYREAIASIENSPIAAHDEAPALMLELAHVLRVDNKDKEADQWEAKAKKIRENRYE